MPNFGFLQPFWSTVVTLGRISTLYLGFNKQFQEYFGIWLVIPIMNEEKGNGLLCFSVKVKEIK